MKRETLIKELLQLDKSKSIKVFNKFTSMTDSQLEKELIRRKTN